jgi:sigma-54 dependent transcriptional regulator, acetoin dehydrogenase operon transcriptional activator AcoR
MTDAQRRESGSRSSNTAAVREAWQRFVAGEDDVRGVRREVVVSWHRCRDQYRIDPFLSEAPVAVAEVAHPLEHDVVFAELGFRAAAIAHEVANCGGIVIVADATGRVLAEWGDKATLSAAAGIRLAPSFCWSESAVGTNGMGTALLGAPNPMVIRREEHWCEAFHDWTCAGVAVRDVVNKEPIAVLNISCWRGDLPAPARGWLAKAAADTQSTLRMRARDGGAELLAAYHHARGRSTEPLTAVDTAGKVVIADDTASVLLGVPGNTPAVDSVVRWTPRLPAFINAAQFASKQASHNPDWMGSTQVFTHLSEEPSPIGIRPVFLYGNLVGHLISFGASDGEQLPQAEAGAHVQAQPGRVVGVHDNRMLLLRLAEVSFAESAGNEVWLSTDRGRLRAASSGLDKLDNELAKVGFLRVHRQFVVNLNRVREVERRDRGELVLVMDDQEKTMVPVSRRNARAVRRALGI